MYPYIFNTNCVECGTSIFVGRLSRDLVEIKYILVIFAECIFLGCPCTISNIFVEIVRFVITPKPAYVDEHLKPSTRPYHQEFPEMRRLYHVVVPILQELNLGLTLL